MMKLTRAAASAGGIAKASGAGSGPSPAILVATLTTPDRRAPRFGGRRPEVRGEPDFRRPDLRSHLTYGAEPDVGGTRTSPSGHRKSAASGILLCRRRAGGVFRR